MVMKSQIGASAPSFIAVLMMVAAGAWYALEETQTKIEAQKGDQVYAMRGQAMERINALQACYNDTRAWCDPNSLSEYGLTPAGVSSSVVTRQETAGDNLALTVRAPTPEIAAAFSKHVMNAVVAGSEVTFTIEPPTRSHILQGQIQRWADPEFGRNTLESDVLMNGNNVPNIDEAQARLGRFEKLETETHTVDRLIVNERLDIGAHTISFAGNTLAINAERTAISGNASVGGDVSLNGHDIEGIGAFNAAEVEADKLLATSGTIRQASGTRIEYTAAAIESTTSTRFTSDTYTTKTFEVDELSVDSLSGNVQAASGNVGTLDFGAGSGDNWNYTTGKAGRLESNSSELGVSGGQSLTLTGDLQGNQLAGNSAQYGTLAVAGLMTGGQFTSANDFTSSLSSVNKNFLTLQTQGTDIANNENAIGQTKSKVDSVSSQVSKNTGNIQDNASDIGSNKQVINNNSGAITENEKDIGKVADRLDDSADELGLWQDRLDKCMYQTRYCIPQDPKVSLSCASCSSSAERDTFSGTAVASITDCRQGCTYSWVTSGTGLQFSGCSSGSVSKGGSASPSCSVSAKVDPQQSATGTIQILVKNSHYTQRSASASVPVNYRNLTPDTKWQDVLSYACSPRCFVRKSGSGGASASITAYPTIDGQPVGSSSVCPSCRITDVAGSLSSCEVAFDDSEQEEGGDGWVTEASSSVKFSSDLSVNSGATSTCQADFWFKVSDGTSTQTVSGWMEIVISSY